MLLQGFPFPQCSACSAVHLMWLWNLCQPTLNFRFKASGWCYTERSPAWCCCSSELSLVPLQRQKQLHQTNETKLSTNSQKPEVSKCWDSNLWRCLSRGRTENLQKKEHICSFSSPSQCLAWWDVRCSPAPVPHDGLREGSSEQHYGMGMRSALLQNFVNQALWESWCLFWTGGPAGKTSMGVAVALNDPASC